MEALDIMALVVLIVLLLAGVGVVAALGMAPGRIARTRNHPQAEAINVCGWWGILTMGLLLPLAFIWAYTVQPGSTASTTRNDEEDVAQ